MKNSQLFFISHKTAALGLILILSAGQFAHAQATSILLEACNQMKDAKKRMACILEATKLTPPPTKILPETKIESMAHKDLTIEDAIGVCSQVVSALRTDQTIVYEDKEESTDSILAVSWKLKPEDVKSSCGVDRIGKMLSSLTIKGNKIPTPLLAEMVGSAKMHKEIDSGKYDNFVTHATQVRHFLNVSL